MVDRIKPILLSVAVSGLMGVTCTDALAVESKNTGDNKPLRVADAGKPKVRDAPKIQVDKKLEQSVLSMVKEHLPDLKPLLERLRKNEPRQYEIAIRDLARSARRLESAKKRDDDLYEREVEVVKSQTAVNLLVAKLKVRDNQTDRQSLRKAIARLNDANIARGQYDIRQLEMRIKRTQQQLAAARKRLDERKSESETNLEKSYAGYLRKAGRQDKNSKPKKRTSKVPSQ